MNCNNNCNQGRACTCTQAAERRDALDLALDFVQVLLILGLLFFVIFGIAGYVSAI